MRCRLPVFVLAGNASSMFAEACPLPWLSSASISLALLLLISFIGLIIARYSQYYLAGERRESHYYRSQQLTLAAASVVVISNHNVRAPCGCCMPNTVGTWQINEIATAYPVAQLSLYEHMAALLLALAAFIKCAQLLVHGWLIQQWRHLRLYRRCCTRVSSIGRLSADFVRPAVDPGLCCTMAIAGVCGTDSLSLTSGAITCETASVDDLLAHFGSTVTVTAIIEWPGVMKSLTRSASSMPLLSARRPL